MSNPSVFPSSAKHQRGVSLIELMVTIVVALLLLGGLIQIYLSNKQSYNAQEQLARMQESGRFAMDLVTTDLRRSGYWGGSVALPMIERGDPGPVDPAHLCVNDDTTWARMIRWRVSGRNNTADGYGCAESYANYDGATFGSDILTLRYAGPAPVTGALEAAGLYLRDNTESGAVMTGALAGSADNDPEAVNGDDVPDSVRPLMANAYYVGDSGRTCPGGQAIPALMRTRLDPARGVPDEEEIASSVERFEVLYLLGDNYVDAAAVDAVADGWLDVSAVRVWALVRGECPEQGLLDSNTYTLGGEVGYTPNDNYRRQLYVSTVMLRNNVVGDVVN
jgi:type IV pilus assembly protein PilW